MRYLSGKMLMFAELLLMSSTYELVETFYFPDEIVQKNYQIDQKSIHLPCSNRH